MMIESNSNLIKPKRALNKAFLKSKPKRSDIEKFKNNLTHLLEQINEAETEEFHKNIISNFLNKTYYDPKNYINTKGRKDLVIHNGKDAKSTVGIIIETKNPTNKAEMVRIDNLNAKALQELVLYYLEERVTHGNFEIKHLVITNIYEWFIFDATVFEKKFFQNRDLVRKFSDFSEKRLSGEGTDFFYKEIAKPFIEGIKAELIFTHFDIREYEKPLRNSSLEDDGKLIVLYKLLSPENLLKLPFANDSNSLDKSFYSELLHIIGLVEIKDKGKRLIQRKKEGERDTASLLENSITQIDNLNRISRLKKPSHFGDNNVDRLFNIGLELVITWVNRILFLKLLEAQLIAYNKGDRSFAFLNIEKIRNFDDLNNLFFGVLAKKIEDREDEVKKIFNRIPYLNSSLFEPTEIEHEILFISNLRDERNLPIFSSTILKNGNGKKLTGNLNTLEYFFRFLDSYDFASEGSENIQEENKTLISASVLGLIFEKINGYKDGSFFTPGFVTMHMCREAIRKEIIQKFNDSKGWNCDSFNSLYGKIDDLEEANNIVNSIKICDPAVGSGHFLVSALNEIIAIKSDLKILLDRDGKRLKEYHVEVINDELIVSDEDDEFFEYNPKSRESQRVQEALFHEKQTIIENCLFGVDINPNSVKICRLRLWIELLKNAYYKSGSNYTELETLPNIDINIKCGNTLVSRFALDSNLKKAFKANKNGWTIATYKSAVQTYKETKSKEQKREVEKIITDIKNDFRTEIGNNDPKVKKLNLREGELYSILNQIQLFELNKKEKKAQKQKQEELEKEITKLKKEIEEIRNNKIYENAFEWRFEFPEVLDNEGSFLGFDIIIGNPPYGAIISDTLKQHFKRMYAVSEGPFEIYKYFVECGLSLLNKSSLLCYISPDTWTNLSYFKKLRSLIVNKYDILSCSETLYNIFDEATVDTNIYLIKNSNTFPKSFDIISDKLKFVGRGEIEDIDNPIITLKTKPALISKIEKNAKPLGEIIRPWRGMSAYSTKAPTKPYNSFTKESEFHRPLLNGGDIAKYTIKWSGEYIKYGKWLHRSRPVEIYDRPHILIQRIRNPKLSERLVAAIDTEKYISSDGLSNLLLLDKGDDERSLKILLAILNSKLINYWFSFYFFDVNIKPEQISKIPINIDFLSTELDLLSDQIIILKKQNYSADTKFLEQEIDKHLYRLYDLTEDEIRIIEE